MRASRRADGDDDFCRYFLQRDARRAQY